jgi:hypothetical protein
MIDPEFEDEQWWLLQLYTRRNGEYFGSVGFSEWYHPYYDIEQEEGGESVFRGIRTSPKTGVWYYALFAITDEDKIVVRIWERDAPSNLSEYTWRLDYRLIGRSWRSAMFSHNGKMYIDSFTVISFSE